MPGVVVILITPTAIAEDGPRDCTRRITDRRKVNPPPVARRWNRGHAIVVRITDGFTGHAGATDGVISCRSEEDRLSISALDE